MKKDHKNMSLGDMADEALRKAVARVVEEHRKSGEPHAVWRDGKVVRVPAISSRGRVGRRGANLPGSEMQNELPRIIPVNDGTRASSGLFGNISLFAMTNRAFFVLPVHAYFMI